MLQGPDPGEAGRIAGEVKEFLQLQKDLGRQFILRSRNKPLMQEPFVKLAEASRNSLSALYQAVAQCRKCPLHENRNQALSGQGPVKTSLMFIGAGPGEEDDRQGRPFSGPDGDLLTRMIQAIQLTREEVFLTQAVKCRPPDDRSPLPEELEACGFFLNEEIRLVSPDILVALGEVPAQSLIRSNKSIFDLRGRWLKYNDRPFMAIFHPAFLLSHPEAKRDAWEDLKKIRRMVDELGTK
jgi:DNA polymerase